MLPMVSTITVWNFLLKVRQMLLIEVSTTLTYPHSIPQYKIEVLSGYDTSILYLEMDLEKSKPTSEVGRDV